MSKIIFPLKAKYKRFSNRIYFSIDFKDKEELEFANTCEKPSSNAIGNVFYRSCKSGITNLVNINELEYKED